MCWPNQQSAGGGSSAKRSSTRRSIVKVSNLGKHGGKTHGTYEVRLTPPLLTQWRHKTRRNTHHRWSACSSSHLGAAQRRLATRRDWALRPPRTPRRRWRKQEAALAPQAAPGTAALTAAAHLTISQSRAGSAPLARAAPITAAAHMGCGTSGTLGSNGSRRPAGTGTSSSGEELAKG